MWLVCIEYYKHGSMVFRPKRKQTASTRICTVDLGACDHVPTNQRFVHVCSHPVRALSFSCDGQLLTAGSEDPILDVVCSVAIAEYINDPGPAVCVHWHC